MSSTIHTDVILALTSIHVCLCHVLDKRCDFFFFFFRADEDHLWQQSSINVSRCALKTRWAGKPCAAFPVFLNVTSSCYTFVHHSWNWQRAAVTYQYILESYPCVLITYICRFDQPTYLGDTYSYTDVDPIGLMTLPTTFITTGFRSTRQISIADVPCHVLP